MRWESMRTYQGGESHALLEVGLLDGIMFAGQRLSKSVRERVRKGAKIFETPAVTGWPQRKIEILAKKVTGGNNVLFKDRKIEVSISCK